MDFVDEVNPTRDEIRRWAFTPGAMYPMQDWDVIIASEALNDDLYFELADDDSCPSRDVFVQILYLIVGDAFRTTWRTRTREQIDNLIERGRLARTPDLGCWSSRARELIANKRRFDYHDWCGGKLARSGRDE